MSPESLYTYVAVLSGEEPLPHTGGADSLRTRFSYADNIRQAHDYLFQKLAEWNIPAFSDSFTGQSFRDVWVSENGEFLAVAGDGGRVFVSADGGFSWVRGDVPVTEVLTAILFSDTLVGFCVGRNGIVLRTQDGGFTWEVRPAGVTADLEAIACAGSTAVWVVGDDGCLLSSADAGETWSPVDLGTAVHLYDIVFPSARVGLIAGDKGHVFRTENAGDSWEPRSVPVSTRLYAMDMADTALGWAAGMSGRIFRTSDGGDTWSLCIEDPDHLGFFGISFWDSAHGVACGSRHLLLYTENGGESWVRRYADGPTSFFSVQMTGDSAAWFSGPQVIACTEDAGSSFSWGPAAFPERWANVIGERTGTKHPHRVFIIGAHYDSISDTPFIRAPGADDNASGVAAVLEIARVLSSFDLERTVRFAFFSGEEQGMVGSRSYASSLAASGDTIVGCLILDMVGWGSESIALYARTPDDSLALRGQEIAQTLVPDLFVAIEPDSFMRWSDHASFWDAGIQSILAIEQQWIENETKHTVEDRLEGMNLTLEYLVTQFAAALVLDRAGVVELGISDCFSPPRLTEREGAIHVSWELCELLNCPFVLERSGRDLVFSGIDSVKPSAPASYDFLDETAEPGESYTYRMRIETGAGRVYTRAKQLTLSMIGNPRLANLSVFPNPASEKVLLSWYQHDSVPVTIRLYDVQGRLLFGSTHTNPEAGWNSAVVGKPLLVSLPSGVYFLSVTGDRDVLYGKLVVLR